MSRTTLSRRPQVQRLGLVGTGTAVLLVGLASPAGAADVTIPLEPSAVGVSGFPLENYGVMDLMGNSTPTPVPVEYEDTLTVELPAELVDAGAVVDLDIDTDGDEIPDVSYTSGATLGDPDYLDVTGEGTDTLVITLPVDGGATGPLGAYLTIDPGGTTLGPEFTAYPFQYFLAIDSAVLDPEILAPPLVADSTLPCATAAACTVTVGSTTTFTLPTSSLLRQVGVSDLTGFEVALQALDGNGVPTSAAPVELTVQVSADGQSATFVVPAGTPAGQYFLLAVQPTTLGASLVLGEITVAAAPSTPAVVPPAAAPTTAAPSTQAVAANVGLRSNTGVTAPAAESSTGTVAAGAGLLLLAGAGGVAVARTRRRPAVETGTGEA